MTEFGHVLGILEPWIRQYGAPAIFLILMFESFGAPLPGESLLVVAAFLAGRGDISLPGLFLAAWAGAVIGDNIGYLIGKKLGRKLLLHYGGKVGLNAQRLRRAETALARYGPVAVGLARFVNVLRQLNGVVAGALGMDWRRFLIFNAVGGALWVLLWTMVGLFLGEHGAAIAALIHKLGFLGALFVLIASIAVLTYIFRHRVVAALRRDNIGKSKDC